MDRGFYFYNCKNQSYAGSNKPRAKRIMFAFNRLYEEYKKVNHLLQDCLQQATGYKIKEEKSQEYNSQPEYYVKPVQQNHSFYRLRSNNYRVNQNYQKVICRPYSNMFHQSPSSIQSSSTSSTMAKHNISIYRMSKTSRVLRHNVSYTLPSGVNGKQEKHYSSAPVILELMNPKIQKRIEKVMRYCPFVSDPLEVIAELRVYNYNCELCIRHLRDTKPLRELLDKSLYNDIRLEEEAAGNYSHQEVWTNETLTLQPRDHQAEYYCISPDASNIFSSAIDDDLIENDDVNNIDCIDNNTTTPLALSPSHDDEEEDDVDENSFHNNKNVKVKQVMLNNDKLSCFNHKEMKSQATSPCYFMLPTPPPPPPPPPPEMIDQSTSPEMKSYCTVGVQTACEPIIDKPILSSLTKRALTQANKEIKIIKNHYELIVNLMKLLQENHLKEINNLEKKCEKSLEQLRPRLLTDLQRNKMIFLAKQVEELKRKLSDEIVKRKQIFETLQDHLGNIRVYCRVRLMPDCQQHLVKPFDEEKVQFCETEYYHFQQVFTSQTTQMQIYQHMQPLIQSFLDGYNVCFMTYGGEASGKTHTLLGQEEPEQQGLIPNALNTILLEQNKRRKEMLCQQSKLEAFAIEIYNDNYGDLIANTQNVNLFVDSGLDVVSGKLEGKVIESITDVMQLISYCRSKRRVAKTALSPASSRSHLIILIKLTVSKSMYINNNNDKLCSYLAMCDLAGFEDTKRADTNTNRILSTEAGFINKSLTAFNRLFISLRNGQNPNSAQYRDSKLTHFLKAFLTNSGKCALIVNVRSDPESRSTTQSSLRFGMETQKVELGKSKKQIIREEK